MVSGISTSAPRLLRGALTSEARSRLQYGKKRADGDNLSGKIKKLILFGDILTYS